MASFHQGLKIVCRECFLSKSYSKHRFLRKLVVNSKAKETACGVHTSAPACKTVLSDPENTGQEQRGVNFDVLGSWNNRLSMDIEMEESIKKGKLIPKIPLEEVGIASLIGRRKVSYPWF